MKGIILAGGQGTRLQPLTLAVSKQLLPVYDKPLIYYPLSVLMLAGIREILIITKTEEAEQFQRLLGSGKKWGLCFTYATQDRSRGIADAFLIAKDFIGKEPVSLVLGDNIFFGTGFWKQVQDASKLETGANIFAYTVRDVSAYGAVALDESGNPIDLKEKPVNAKSYYAVPGLYFYDAQVVEIAEKLSPSSRGELEITDINRAYLGRGQLKVQMLSRGVAWLDAGTHENLLHASNFVQAVEERQGLMIGCPEEVAYRLGLIDRAQLKALGAELQHNHYGQYLLRLLDEDI